MSTENIIEESRNLRKERIGKVFSNKMDKSITVVVERKMKHPIYGKFVKIWSNDGVLAYCITPYLGGFLAEHPGLRLSILSDRNLPKQGQGYADVVVGFEQPKQAEVISFPVASAACACCGTGAASSIARQTGRPSSAPRRCRGVT